MKHLTVPIDQAGRVVLPKDVRQELAIEPGDLLKITIEGSSVTLTPSRQKTGLKKKGRALVFTTVGAETLSSATVQEVLDSSRDEKFVRVTAEAERRSKK